jgi:hypothetical protein
MTSDAAFTSRTSAATVMGVVLTFWLPFLPAPTGTALVNPLWAVLFGIVPALVSGMGFSSVTLLAALAWPFIVTMLAVALLIMAAGRASRVAHVLIWLSFAAITPDSFAHDFEVYRSTAIYRFLSM